MRRLKQLSLLCLIGAFSVLLTFHAYSADWPQWRGLNRDGISHETNLLEQWPENGPEFLRQISGIGDGFSSPSISEGMLYVTGKVDKEEVLSAYDLEGNLKWQTPYGKTWTKGYPEARTTPTVDGGMAYVISGAGEMACLDASTGDLKWHVDALTWFEGKQGGWGTAESPLVVDDKVIYTPCGAKTTLVALNKHTGETVWMSESLHDHSGYVSPILIEYGGRRLIVTVTGTYILGVDPGDGTIVWKVNYSETPPGKKGGDINPVTPLYHDGRIYVTSGYNDVGVMLQLSEDASEASMLWYDETLDTHHGGVVLVNGYIFGSNWHNNSQGNWACIDWQTGKPRYETEWENKGSIIAANGMLYCYEEKKGHLALVKAMPEAFQVVSSFQITEGGGPHWAHPVISDGRLYVRHGDVLMVYNIQQ